MRFVKARHHGARMCHGLVISAVGLLLAGCAAVSKDVDAYYRQMAINYGEAIEKARVDEAAAEGKARVMAASKDDAGYRRAQRQLKHIKSWEEHCARERERFEKAARWMETHFDAVGKAVPREDEVGKGLEAAYPELSGDHPSRGVAQPPGD